MELDAFTCRLGDGQGRVATADGEVRFVLGDTEPRRLFDLVAGDRLFGAVLQKNPDVAEPGAEDLHDIGCAARLNKMVNVFSNSMKLMH